MRRIALLLFTLFIALPVGAGAVELRIGSWNIERLGHGNHKSYKALGQIASRFDFLAVQEVMTGDGLKRLHRALEAASGERWGMMESHSLGRNGYKEKYAFLWRLSRVEYVDGAVVYLDTTDHFAREPYSARFRERESGFEFIAATVHITYGDSVADRTPEIRALRDYWEWLAEIYPHTEARFLMGDFNLPPDHAAWAPLKRLARPLITEGASSLSANEGRYANLYDNIWIPRSAHLPVNRAGVLKYPPILGWSHKQSRRHVSDHAPVYVTLGRANVDTGPRQSTVQPSAGAEPRAAAVRGNRNSRIYHRPDCPAYDRIAESNRVPFPSEQHAREAGYRIAGNCP